MKQFFCSGLVFAALALGALRVHAEPLIFEHVTLIDGTGRAPQADMTVVIEGHRFQSVAPSALDQQISGRRVDGRGKFLIPGLMDVHIHLRGGTVITKDGLRAVSTLIFPVACSIAAMASSDLPLSIASSALCASATAATAS